MARLADWPGPSPRTAKVVLAVLLALIVGFFVAKAFVPDLGIIEGRSDVVEVGETIDVLVQRQGGERVDLTVTEVARVTDLQREEWQLSRDRLIGDSIDDSDDVYLVRFGFEGEGSPSMVASNWRLVDTDDEEYESLSFALPEEADCARDSCALVVVPGGTEVEMVRFYGVALDRREIVGENWAGWRLTE